jgi:hypothetical protein
MPAWLVGGTRQRRKRSCRLPGNKTPERCTPNDRKRCRIRDRSQMTNSPSGYVRIAARDVVNSPDWSKYRAEVSPFYKSGETP